MKGHILVIEDEKLIGWSLKKDLSKEDYEVVVAETASEGMRAFADNPFDLTLLDIRLPDGSGKEVLKYIRSQDPLAAVIVLTANDDVRTAVECMQSGAFNYLHKPFDFDELRHNIEKAIEARRLRKQVAEWESTERSKYDFSSVIAESKSMKLILDLIRQIISSQATTILIQGQSGTGKDLLARTIHYSGARASKPFVSLNCAAIPSMLLESELFGHEKGAFTDAKQSKKGLVEEAAGGTLFLDEIGDMAKDLQAKLLHLIDQKRFRKVGGVKEIEAEIRIVAATNKDLKQEVAAGRFREDLFYRLNVVQINIPPLKERKEDLPALLSFFIGHFNREFKKSIRGIDPEAMAILKNYAWPGNVRELKNVIERAMILNTDELITPKHLPSEIDCSCNFRGLQDCAGDDGFGQKVPECLLGVSLEKVEKQLVIMTLQKTDGNQSKAARVLGIGRDALRYKMQKYGLLEACENAEVSSELGEKAHAD